MLYQLFLFFFLLTTLDGVGQQGLGLIHIGFLLEVFEGLGLWVGVGHWDSVSELNERCTAGSVCVPGVFSLASPRCWWKQADTTSCSGSTLIGLELPGREALFQLESQVNLHHLDLARGSCFKNLIGLSASERCQTTRLNSQVLESSFLKGNRMCEAGRQIPLQRTPRCSSRVYCM